MQRSADPFSLLHCPTDCRLQESSRSGRSPHYVIHAGSHLAPSAIEEHSTTPQQEEHQIVDERIPQSQPAPLALIGPIYPAGSPPHVESRQSSTPSHPLHQPNEDEEMDNTGGRNTPASSESRDTTPRPRLLSKGKGRMVYSDDDEEMANTGGNSSCPPTPQGQETRESQQVSGVTLKPSSWIDSSLA
jgi:hypothetical protein